MRAARSESRPCPWMPRSRSRGRSKSLEDGVGRRGMIERTDKDWLVARPVAHRGLHDAARGIIENTPSSVRAAAEAGYAIEVDLQITADGEAMVHHDEALGRLTDGTGAL